MPLQPSVVNNFTQGLKTEFTGLNFPENAAFDTENCVYTLIGDVLRREGIDYEANAITNTVNRTNLAVSSYKWNNAGGDGSTQVVVLQIGSTLYFYKSSAATITSPLSTTILASTVSMSSFIASGGTFDPTIECQFTSGNGYLFVFHPNCDPFYCTYTAGTIAGNVITINIRDFQGFPETTPDNFRPTTLSIEHQYNLINQGWSSNVPWQASVQTFNWPVNNTTGQSITLSISSQTNTTSVTVGAQISLSGYINTGTFVGYYNIIGIVTTYSTPFTSITFTVQANTNNTASSNNIGPNFMSLINTGQINTWFTNIHNYPSNSDIWWLYKNSSGVFDPLNTIANVPQTNVGSAPKGYFVLNAFNQDRSTVSGIVGLTRITTLKRPATGTFYAGRVFYSGVNDSQAATGDAPFYTWTENIYFSPIIERPAQFGNCYQQNDLTSQNLFALLPSDGGVISIPGCGSIYKLFALKFGLLVFASNGIWYIGGSQGIGFAANDYTVTKISSIRSITATSIVDVNGYPMFWNEEGIYYVSPSQQGGSAHSPDIALDVINLCVGTILTFYSNIPLQSKKYARGDYDPLNYIVQWWYKSTNETGITDRYQYDSVLNFNTVNKAFYPWRVMGNNPSVNGIIYVAGPGGSSSSEPALKLITSLSTGGTYKFTFSEERDSTNWVDWFTAVGNGGINYISFFTAGYKLSGKALAKFNPLYVYTYHNNIINTQFKIQGIWDYAINRNSNRWGSEQLITINLNTGNYGKAFRRHKIRGHGYVLQFRIQSVDGKPFDVQGWAVADIVNTSP